LDRAALPAGCTGTAVPGGRRDDLVILDLSVLHLDPMRQRPPDRLGCPPPAPVALLGFDVPRVSQAELAQNALRLSIKIDHLVHPGEVTQSHAGATKPLVHV